MQRERDHLNNRWWASSPDRSSLSLALPTGWYQTAHTPSKRARIRSYEKMNKKQRGGGEGSPWQQMNKLWSFGSVLAGLKHLVLWPCPHTKQTAEKTRNEKLKITVYGKLKIIVMITYKQRIFGPSSFKTKKEQNQQCYKSEITGTTTEGCLTSLNGHYIQHNVCNVKFLDEQALMATVL